MSKKIASRSVISEHQAITISSGVQKAVLIMSVLAWFGSAVLTALSVLPVRDGGFGWMYVYFTLSTALPLLFFITALMYVWGRYQQLLQKLFVSVILASSGYAAAQVLISVLILLNNHYGWILTNDNANSATIYRFEWLLMLLSYAAYVIVLGVLPRHKKERN